MATHTAIPHLIEVASAKGKAVASNGRWWATKTAKGNVIVGHHSTQMLIANPTTRRVTPLSPGWQSETDKSGISRLLWHERDLVSTETEQPVQSYWQLYAPITGETN